MSTASLDLDATFRALASPTRRAIVERLGRGPASVSELAEPFAMALPSFMQHLRILEISGLVTSRKRGRVRTIRIQRGQLEHAAGWLDAQRRLWEQRLDQLDDYLNSLKERE